MSPYVLNLICQWDPQYPEKTYSRSNTVNKLFYLDYVACGENHLPMEIKMNCSTKNPVVY